uniref:B30.2/SPRY domain-containing protein n=1 Tax=Cyprinus carpio TaxID=7962 RepID=A0A8C1MKK1_CYPCA
MKTHIKYILKHISEVIVKLYIYNYYLLINNIHLEYYQLLTGWAIARSFATGSNSVIKKTENISKLKMYGMYLERVCLCKLNEIHLILFSSDCRFLTLDPNTVNELLRLSEGNRAAKGTAKVHSYPDHPDRFDGYRQVLSRESVCGRCYWELEWGGVRGVDISVSYKSISRKGGDECLFGFNDQSWSLYCYPDCYLFWHNSIQTDLPVKSISRRIGVYVDHSVGTLSFYNVYRNTVSLIYTVQTTFTQTLYLGINVSSGSSVKLCDLKAEIET